MSFKANFPVRGDKTMRGVNKLVVEVRPEDGYFEKAILFIRPEAQSAPQKDISESAEILLSDISQNKYTKHHTRLSRPMFLFLGIAAGSLVSWLMILLIGII